MEADVTDTSGPASPPNPPQDRPGNPVPEYIAVLLHAVSILLGYGRHLLATVHHRAAAPTLLPPPQPSTLPGIIVIAT